MRPLVSPLPSALPPVCPVMVAVIGPPGAGKSTVVSGLAEVDGTVVFRLREAVRAYPDVVGAIRSNPDPLAWIDGESVLRVLVEAFIVGRFPTGSGPVLLDNFPGTAPQLELLIEVAAAVGRRVALLELRAGASVVTARTLLRRVCPQCGPDAHHPAVAAVGEPQRSAGCGAVLVRRDSDTPLRHRLRLARYLDNASGILALAQGRRIPHLAIDADRPTALVHQTARSAVDWLTQTAMTPPIL